MEDIHFTTFHKMASPPFHNQGQLPHQRRVPTTPHKHQGSTVKHIHLLFWDAAAGMTSNRARRNLFEPLSFVRVSRHSTDIPLSREAESLVNLFSHAYDHSYDLLQDTDDIRCITRALGLSMEAVKAARTARSSQEDTNNNEQSSDEDHAEAQANEDDQINGDIDEDAEEIEDDNLQRSPTEVTQPNRDMDDSDSSTHKGASIDDDGPIAGDTTDGDSFIAEESIYSEGSSGSSDLTDSEYDDDVSEVSLVRP